MRPKWMKCSGCLFFKMASNVEPNDGYCLRSPRTVTVDANKFCNSWTCERCLKPWRISGISYESAGRTKGWDVFHVLNHLTCREKEMLNA